MVELFEVASNFAILDSEHAVEFLAGAKQTHSVINQAPHRSGAKGFLVIITLVLC